MTLFLRTVPMIRRSKLRSMRGEKYTEKLAERDASRCSARPHRRLATQRERPAIVPRELGSLAKTLCLLNICLLLQRHSLINLHLSIASQLDLA